MLIQRVAFPLVASLLVIFGSAQISSADLIILGKGHAPIYISDKDRNEFDFDNDNKIDYHVRAHFTGNSNQLYKVDYKIVDSCVDGNSTENAIMKLGFTSNDFSYLDRTWFTNVTAWTPWHKAANNDANKQIDLVNLTKGALPHFPFPSSGEDIINGTDKKGPFTHKDSIPELDGQAGWQGSIFFKGFPREFFMWTIHPGDGSSGCETLTGFSIPIIIKP